MKLKNAFLTLAAVSALAGCSNRTETVVVSTPADSVVTNAPQEVVKTPKNSDGPSTDNFMSSMDLKLHRMDDRINEFAQRAATLQGEAKIRADEAVADLREQRKTVGEKYDQLKAASKDAWESTKEGVETGWARLEQSYDNFKSKFN